MPDLTVELTSENICNWLSRFGFRSSGGRFSELGGGVSNRVILAELPDSDLPARRLVIKQSLGKLRVAEEWLSDRERIFSEAAAMRWLHPKVHGGTVPEVYAEDRENFAIAIGAAPEDAEMWKTRLFRREFDTACAVATGKLLGSIVAATWQDAESETAFGDQTVFDQLRIDPYYRHAARVRPELAGYVNGLIAQSATRRCSLVHGDWSPKNLLWSTGREELWAIDWEVVHFGDPSYDVAFLLNHLLMKSIAMPWHRAQLAGLALAFLTAYRSAIPPEGHWIERAALEHLPALLLARVAGKSPAEYLDAGMRETAWQKGLFLIRQPVGTVEEAFRP